MQQQDLRQQKKNKIVPVAYHNSDDSFDEMQEYEQGVSQDEQNEDDSFDMNNGDGQKTKNIKKGKKQKKQKGPRGRPRKQLQTTNLKDMNKGTDLVQFITQDGSELNIKERNYNYQRKFPKDPFKLNMIKFETKALRFLQQLQNTSPQQQTFNTQQEEEFQIFGIVQKQYIVFDRLEWIKISAETGYNNSSLLSQIYFYISDELECPSDPINQEFISLSLENYIFRFCQHLMISKEMYFFNDQIVDDLLNKPYYRFYEIHLDDLCQIVLADLSLQLYQFSVLQQVNQYLNIIKQFSHSIKQTNPQKKYQLKTFSCIVNTTNQKQIDIILPFEISEVNVDLIDSSLLEIIKFFNIQWTSIIECRLKYYGMYVQLVV